MKNMFFVALFLTIVSCFFDFLRFMFIYHLGVLFYFIILSIYGVISFKIQEWETFSRLGLWYSVPVLFEKKYLIYKLVDILLFLLVLVFPLFSKINNYFIFLSLFVAFFVSGRSRIKPVHLMQKGLIDKYLEDGDKEAAFEIAKMNAYDFLKKFTKINSYIRF